MSARMLRAVALYAIRHSAKWLVHVAKSGSLHYREIKMNAQVAGTRHVFKYKKKIKKLYWDEPVKKI